LDWLETHPILSGVLLHLDNIPGEHHEEIQRMLTWEKYGSSRYYYIAIAHDQRQENEPPFKGYTPTTLEEHASACLQLMRATIQKPHGEFYRLLAVYITGQPSNEAVEALDTIKDNAVAHLYEYLDETLDGINGVNGLLRKYKQYAEWFEKERIHRIL